MSTSERLAILNARLTKIQAAINGTLDRGVASYDTEIQSLTSMSLKELRELEQVTLNEIARLERIAAGGSRFGKIGFTRPT